MTFLGDGHWAIHIALAAGAEASLLEWKFRSGGLPLANDPNNKVMRGGRRHRTPDQPTTGALFTVTFDTAGTALAGATNVNIHMGYDPGWSEASARSMTNIAGSVWEYATTVSTNATVSVNWVFNGQITGPVGISPADWKAFLAPFVNP